MKFRFTGLLVLACLASNAGHASGIDDSMSLVDAIESVRQQGIGITYSSRLVEPWMRVRETPASADPVTGLGEALAVYGLVLETDSQGRWMIVRGHAPESSKASETTHADTVKPHSATEPGLEIGEVKITASRYSLYSQSAVHEQFLSGEEISLLPHIADDVFRAFHRVPGAAANDFSAPFNLRGGAINEVKVVLDGLEILEPYHMHTLFSPLSVIDPGIVGQAVVSSGGFTAEHGNYSSGVIEVSSKHGAAEPVHEVGVSFVSSFLRSSGPLGGAGAYQVSARRGYLDLLADTVAIGDEEFSPRYGDLFAKLEYALTDATSIDARVLLASDKVQYDNAEEGEAGTGEGSLQYAWLTLDSELGDYLRWQNTVFSGQGEMQDWGVLRNPPRENLDRSYDRDFSSSGVSSDLSWQPGASQLWVIGLQYRRLEAGYDYYIDSIRQFDYFNDGMPVVLHRDIEVSSKGSEFGAYLRYRAQPVEWATLELGLRWDRQTYTGTEDDTQLSPRLNALFQLGTQTDLRVGWGQYYQPQGIHELQVEDGVTGYFPAERADHAVIGIRHRFNTGLELQLDAYQKNYSDLRPRFENVLDRFEYAPEADFDRVMVTPSSARAQGVEMTLRDRQAGSLDWWLNYTWSRAEDVVDGVTVPRSWDQRHAVTGNLTWRAGQWVFSLVGRYHSGWPRTPLAVIPEFDETGGLIAIGGDLSQRNQDNYNDYFRLDARVSRTVELNHGSFEYYLEIFNLLDTENQCCVADHDVTVTPTPGVSPNFDDYLPLFPSFGFVWRFGPGS